MKIVIFGATGTVGQNLIEQALMRGHEITAFTRNPEKLTETSGKLTVLMGDVLNPSAVTDAVKNQDAVICALGMPLMNKEGLRAAGTKNIVAAMNDTGVKRLICLSALGIGDSRSILPFYYKFLIVPLFMRHLFADHTAQETIVTNSKLNWTIVRPGNFTKGSITGTYQIEDGRGNKQLKLKISPKDVAGFMLKQLDTDQFLKMRPSISY